jgi:hypothetical protein
MVLSMSGEDDPNPPRRQSLRSCRHSGSRITHDCRRRAAATAAAFSRQPLLQLVVLLLLVAAAVATVAAEAVGNGNGGDSAVEEFRFDKAKCLPGPHAQHADGADAALAPDVFNVRWKTTAAEQDVVLDVYRDWAPTGVQRFYELILDNYYNCGAFYRVVPGACTVPNAVDSVRACLRAFGFPFAFGCGQILGCICGVCVFSRVCFPCVLALSTVIRSSPCPVLPVCLPIVQIVHTNI